MGNDSALFNSIEATGPLAPGTRPVRIGEGGPSFGACAARGQVVNISPTGETYLPLRAAPFVEADEVARLGEGAVLFTCARSLDQRWQGVIVPPADTPDADCGVVAPIAAARNYDGPCRSGWVASSFVRSIGG